MSHLLMKMDDSSPLPSTRQRMMQPSCPSDVIWSQRQCSGDKDRFPLTRSPTWSRAAVGPKMTSISVRSYLNKSSLWTNNLRCALCWPRLPWHPPTTTSFWTPPCFFACRPYYRWVDSFESADLQPHFIQLERFAVCTNIQNVSQRLGFVQCVWKLSVS